VSDVRLATLQDAAAITEIHCSNIAQWMQYDAAGAGQPATYDDLTLYERWQNGGPWLSLETCAVHLNRLLSGKGTPLVVEANGAVLGTAEVYENFEAAPFQHHLSIGVLYVHAAHQRRGLGRELLDYIATMADLMKCDRVTVDNPDVPDFYTRYGFHTLRTGRQIRIPTQAGRAFYQTSELADREVEQIKGWHMPLGRTTAMYHAWQSLFPLDWAAGIPELLNAQMAHLKITAAGQNALLFIREADEPNSLAGECSVMCWSSRPLSAPLLAAIRDHAHREGFDTILTTCADQDWSLLLAADAHPTDEHHTCYELNQFTLPQ
jgi:ribosomal protein S18 acetylase RimI-like enzyme